MVLTRSRLERWQVAIYAAAIAAGAGLGLGVPAAGGWLAPGLWPLLALLLFATFLQLPLADLRTALRGGRELAALLAGNFLAVPLLVWVLLQWLPDDPSLRLGFLLVLLVPCTDWFTTFAHLGGGDGRLALAATPVLLLVQMVLLPFYLWWFLGPAAVAGMSAGPFLQVFAGVVLVPLLLAAWVERRARSSRLAARAVARSALLPVPLLGVVLFVIAAGEVHGVLAASGGLSRAVVLFAAYLIAAPAIAVAVARSFGLGAAATATIVFSLGTRNSFVVLPLALAWPGAGTIAGTVVVVQSLVELGGMLVLLSLVPRWLGRPPAR